MKKIAGLLGIVVLMGVGCTSAVNQNSTQSQNQTQPPPTTTQMQNQTTVLTDDIYKYSLEFPDSWKNVTRTKEDYVTKPQLPVEKFRFTSPTDSSRSFVVYIFKKSDEAKLPILNDTPRASEYDKENSIYRFFFNSEVFCYGPDCKGDTEPGATEVKQIWNTFKSL